MANDSNDSEKKKATVENPSNPTESKPVEPESSSSVAAQDKPAKAGDPASGKPKSGRKGGKPARRRLVSGRVQSKKGKKTPAPRKPSGRSEEKPEASVSPEAKDAATGSAATGKAEVPTEADGDAKLGADAAPEAPDKADSAQTPKSGSPETEQAPRTDGAATAGNGEAQREGESEPRGPERNGEPAGKLGALGSEREPMATQSDPNQSQVTRRLWPIFLLLLVLIGGAAAWVYWDLQHQGDTTGPAMVAEELRELESLLAELDFATGEVDGVVDDQTRAAINLFQEFAGLPVDGEPSPELLAELREVSNLMKDGG